ncbi:MAG: hypothetical protein GY849_25185, partial [Deltaproteobacteria bacterium]|nr:hypothetical protein [Deltaproteobacteria bacterium]
AAFMAHVPESIQEDWAHSEPAKRQERWHDLGALAGNESKIMGEMGKKIAADVREFCGGEYRKASIASLVQSGVETVRKWAEAGGSEVKIDHETDTQEPFVDTKMIQHCFRLLMEVMTALCAPKGAISLKTEEALMDGRAGIRVVMTAQGQTWDEGKIAPLYFALRQDNDIGVSLNFLTACFMIHHHAGNVAINREAREGPGMEVFIPLDFTKESRPDREEDYMEKLHRHFDIWDAALL